MDKEKTNELQDNIITVGVKRFRCTEVLSSHIRARVMLGIHTV